MTRMVAAADGSGGLTRNRQVNPELAAFLVIDVQNYCAIAGAGEHAHIDPKDIPTELSYYFDRLERTVLPNIARILAASRTSAVEPMFTTIENLTDDSEHPVGEWNEMVIECRGDSITVSINGDEVNRGTGCTASSGQIAIQAEGAAAAFRLVELTPLP